MLFQIIFPSFILTQFAIFETLTSLIDEFLEGWEVPDFDSIIF